MKTLIIRLAKRYLLKAVNQLLLDHKNETATVTYTIGVWITRLEAIIKQLKAINNRVSDGEIDNEELELTTTELKRLVKDF